jgi:hypothetical protein
VNRTARHEASHAAMAIVLGREVDHVWRTTSAHSWAGETNGFCFMPFTRLEFSQLPVILVGYMSVGEPGWPPSFEDAQHEQLEGLGIVVRRLGIGEDDYNEVVELVRELLVDDDFVRLRNAIERALDVVPRLECEDLEALAAIPTRPRKKQRTEARKGWRTRSRDLQGELTCLD